MVVMKILLADVYLLFCGQARNERVAASAPALSGVSHG